VTALVQLAQLAQLAPPIARALRAQTGRRGTSPAQTFGMAWRMHQALWNWPQVAQR
jgi:hypothetical protein